MKSPVYFLENQNRRCSPDRRLSECSRGQSTAVLQQQHVDRLHRHTIHTTSAGMAHANGPAARCHFSSCPSFFSQLQRSVCTNSVYSLLPQHRLIKTSYVYYVPVVLLLLLPLFLSLYLSVFVQGYVTQQYRHFSTTLLFFRSYNEVVVQTELIPYFPSGTYYFLICDHGPDSWHAVICDKLTFFPPTGGCSEGLGAFRFFFK